MPLLSTKYGFEEWYLNALPEDVEVIARAFIKEQKEKIDSLGIEVDPFTLQYFVALGFRVPWEFTCSMTSAIYVAEIRSSKRVHPTARRVAHQIHGALTECYPGIVLHCDLDPGEFDIKRGKDTFIRKE